MEIHRLIKDRWSPVAFSDKKPGRDTIKLLFKAASMAPSSFNIQPWKFIYGIKGEDAVYDTLFELLIDGNKAWAFTAPVLAMSIIETVPPGRESQNKYAWHDTGMAVGNLLLQAMDLELYLHQMGGFDHDGAKEILNLPENHTPGAMMAIGYKGDPSVLEPEIAKRDNGRTGRKPLEEFVFSEKF